MNRAPQDDLENDPLWDLLRKSPAAEPSPWFVDDVVRAARLQPARKSWWQRFRLPMACGALAAATAAFAIVLLSLDPPAPALAPTAGTSADAAPFAALEDTLRTEVLVAAAEHPDHFSDAELVALLTD